MDGPQEQPILYRKCSQKKVRDEDWPVIRSLMEAGAKAPDVAKKYGISPVTINTRASKERWATPRRVAKANAHLSEDDPASAVASLWANRKEESRESLYQGSKKALERFFAMAPVPQSFNEAATAHKLLQNAIEPEGPPERSTNVSVQILSQQGFSPKPAIDV
jgi:hypothetical protein